MHNHSIAEHYVQGLFIQEDASRALKVPGQQPRFGVKASWPALLQQLKPGRKLIHLIRHGEAVSNAVQAAVGELAWASVATECYWMNETSGVAVRLFDPDLTERGRHQVPFFESSNDVKWLQEKNDGLGKGCLSNTKWIADCLAHVLKNPAIAGKMSGCPAGDRRCQDT